MKPKSTAGFLLLAALCVPLSSGCYAHYHHPRHGHSGIHVFHPWAGAAIVGAAIVGAAAIAAAEDAARYRAENCSYRTWYGGRWMYYCGDRWAFYERGVWYAYPPSPPPAPPPPAQAYQAPQGAPPAGEPPAPPPDLPPPPQQP